jgi:hypothetical protein
MHVSYTVDEYYVTQRGIKRYSFVATDDDDDDTLYSLIRMLSYVLLDTQEELPI